MATITRPNSYSSGTKIKSSEVNADFNTIYDDYNGNITNANISGSAAIVGSKLDLSSPGVIGGTTPNSATFTTVELTSIGTGSPDSNKVYKDNIVKAWARCNSGGVILDTFGVSSINRISAGIYSINWANSFSNSNYYIGGAADNGRIMTYENVSADATSVNLLDTGGNPADPYTFSVMAIGKQ